MKSIFEEGQKSHKDSHKSLKPEVLSYSINHKFTVSVRSCYDR